MASHGQSESLQAFLWQRLENQREQTTHKLQAAKLLMPMNESIVLKKLYQQLLTP
ncbi:MAG: hypothetical protein ACI8WB_003661 [Phenylobacterium sp.]